jgi:adenine-specific DNA methylase
VPMVTPHVRRQQPLHPAAQIAIAVRPQHEVEVVGKGTIARQPHGQTPIGVHHRLHAAGGNVRLLKWAEYPTDWDPQTDQRLPVWEVLHQLISVFNRTGETGAGGVFAAVQSKVETARQLAYRLYTLCERAGRAEDARAYNELITSWSAIESAAAKEPAAQQRTLFNKGTAP